MDTMRKCSAARRGSLRGANVTVLKGIILKIILFGAFLFLSENIESHHVVGTDAFWCVKKFEKPFLGTITPLTVFEGIIIFGAKSFLT